MGVPANVRLDQSNSMSSRTTTARERGIVPGAASLARPLSLELHIAAKLQLSLSHSTKRAECEKVMCPEHGTRTQSQQLVSRRTSPLDRAHDHRSLSRKYLEEDPPVLRMLHFSHRMEKDFAPSRRPTPPSGPRPPPPAAAVRRPPTARSTYGHRCSIET